MNGIGDMDTLRQVVTRTVNETPVLDIHTHLYDQRFGDLLLRGPVELTCYHYLLAETNRVLRDHTPAEFIGMDSQAQARLIWQSLFVDRSPLSEATRGVITTWQRLGAPNVRDFDGVLAHFADIDASEHIDLVFERANVAGVIMTNDPLDPKEAAVWERAAAGDPRFGAALRIDSILVNWPTICLLLQGLGYHVAVSLPASSYVEIRRFLEEWITRMRPVYLAASLPATFRMPDDSDAGHILEEVVLPICRERGLALAMMIGTRRGLAPELGDAGDAGGRCDLNGVSYLCRKYPDNRFLLTVLSRENQHEAVILARKFRNLHVFGCWWFNNNPSIIEEITRERIEMLGLSFTPQHSDARILDQLVYKWAHSRQIIAGVLIEKYGYLIDAGWRPTEEEIERDVAFLLGGAFREFIGRADLA